LNDFGSFIILFLYNRIHISLARSKNKMNAKEMPQVEKAVWFYPKFFCYFGITSPKSPLVSVSWQLNFKSNNKKILIILISLKKHLWTLQGEVSNCKKTWRDFSEIQFISMHLHHEQILVCSVSHTIQNYRIWRFSWI